MDDGEAATVFAEADDVDEGADTRQNDEPAEVDNTEEFDKIFTGLEFDSWDEFISYFLKFQEATGSRFKPKSAKTITSANEKFKTKHQLPLCCKYQSVNMVCVYYGESLSTGKKRDSYVARGCQALVRLSVKKGKLRVKARYLVHRNHEMDIHNTLPLRHLPTIEFTEQVDFLIIKKAMEHNVYSCKDGGKWRAALTEIHEVNPSLEELNIRMFKARVRRLTDKYLGTTDDLTSPDEYDLILHGLCEMRQGSEMQQEVASRIKPQQTKKSLRIQHRQERQSQRVKAQQSKKSAPKRKRQSFPKQPHRKKSKTAELSDRSDGDDEVDDTCYGSASPVPSGASSKKMKTAFDKSAKSGNNGRETAHSETACHKDCVTMDTLWEYWYKRDEEDRKLRASEIELRKRELDLRQQELRLYKERFDFEREERMVYRSLFIKRLTPSVTAPIVHKAPAPPKQYSLIAHAPQEMHSRENQIVPKIEYQIEFTSDNQTGYSTENPIILRQT